MSNNCNHDNIETFDKKYLEEKLKLNRSNLNIFLKKIGIIKQSTFTLEEVKRILELRELKEKEGLTLDEMEQRYGLSKPQDKPQERKTKTKQPNQQPQNDKQALIDATQKVGEPVKKIIAGMVFKNTNDALGHVPKLTVDFVNTICDNYNGSIRMEETADSLIDDLMQLPNGSMGQLESSNPYDLGKSLSNVDSKLLEGETKSPEHDGNNAAE